MGGRGEEGGERREGGRGDLPVRLCVGMADLGICVVGGIKV